MPPDPTPAFRLLGPPTVDGAAPLSPQQTHLLAGLLLGGETVTPQALASYIWGHDQPASTGARVRTLVTELRRALAPLGDHLVITRAPGYAIDLAHHTLDVDLFHHHTTRAADDHDPQRTLHHLDRALALWRGPALTGLDTPPARTQAARLDELRLSTMEARADAMLDLGRHRELVADLTAHTNAHPGRERTHAQLMLALFRSGRTEDALTVYRALRAHLAGELGLEPSAELRSLHQRILGADPGLTTPPPRPVPHQLPAGATVFAGRTTELDALTTAADAESRLIVITGPAGTGKSTLAVHWAHHTAHRYPDGQIHLDMRGFDPGPTRSADDHIPAILTDLGVPATRVPTDPDERRTLLRSTLTGRRVLIICDNAATPDQVRPLIPGAPGCLLIATSRDRLAGLVAIDNAHRITLEPLDPTAALDVLAHVIGPARLATEPTAAATLTELCGRLPLALRIAAARLADNPHQTLARFTANTAAAPLDTLRIPGDTRADIRRALTLSYDTLSPAAQRLFRLAAIIPTPAGLTTPHAQAITGENPRPLLDELTARHLLTPIADDRHTYHDLLRELGAELAAADPEHTEALTRLLDHHLTTTPTTEELPNLTAAVHHAARHGPHDRAWKLAHALAPTLEKEAPTEHWTALATAGLTAAEHDNSTLGQAAMHHTLGRLQWRAGDLDNAEKSHTHALTHSRATGDRPGETTALHALGSVAFHKGHDTRALGLWRTALRHARDIGDTATELRVLNNIAAINGRDGHTTAALTALHEVLTIAQREHDTDIQATVHANIGYFHRDRGELTAAVTALTEAARLHHDTGHIHGEINAWCGLGYTHTDAGDHRKARAYLNAAHDEARRTRDHRITLYALCGLADLARTTGDTTTATAHLDDADHLITEHPYERGRHLIALARARTALPHDPTTATTHATRALHLAGDRPTDHAAALAVRATARLHLGDPEGALTDARTALDTQIRAGQRTAEADTRRTITHALNTLNAHDTTTP
ncbi:BTAD domain-containing putative transcriptional regulator [Phytomonospora sp. NPDC050363]|uniref:AfsR/SARP family transcriptional regulator n=1 Tax=Phytomonospora sp. NPDC050363 TaxID=3155642 RepID=UPI0033E272A3